MAPRPDLAHPGYYIRDHVLPSSMSVTKAANLLGVGRPALSNLLNGKASLSPEMAARLERTFGASARELVDMQAAYDAVRAKDKGTAPGARAFVPPFLQLTADDIVEWATSNIAARSRLAVLLRTLVHSTGLGITRVDFPGNDDSQRPGWDGFVEAGQGTPWIPEGKSGWEFGVNRDPKRKAEGDFKKAVRHEESAMERAEVTFVFVTPQRWPGKDVWRKERLAEGKWKDVRVLDASDLEQWLEQSIPAQAWLAAERRDPTQGVRSLDECWRLWEANCRPALSRSLFDEAIEFAGQKFASKLRSPSSEPVVLAADSRDEALAFLSCLFSSDDPGLSALRDRVAVFTEPGPLARLAAGSASFIPVVASVEVERELASHRGSLGSILVYPRNAATVEPDVTLEPLSYTAFERALQEMGCDRDEIDRLSRESGRSPTVLRRRLSSLPAVQTPVWVADARRARDLIPFLFAGAWKADSPGDRIVLELLAGDESCESLEARLAEMLTLDDSPVWSIGSFRGLISKIDALFAVGNRLTAQDLDRFFDVAFLVLSEDDPALDLPEEDQWMADVYGKTREISGALREGIGETLVLLAVHGGSLLRSRLGVDPEVKVRRLIRNLLKRLDARQLEAQSGALPMYAEAAPDEFLKILSEDLASPEPESLKLMRPATSTFGRCPRTGLLWALENTAWAPERLHQTIDVLARLAGPEINDTWSNKPSASLAAIFKRWLPQTAATLDQRIAALDYLIDRYPKIAWPVCMAQIDWRSQVGHYSHKPRWRPDGFGHGEPISDGAEIHRVAVHALERALTWTEHSHETLGDLVEIAGGLGEEYQKRLWEAVSRWAETASGEDKAALRERVRVTTVGGQRRAKSRSGEGGERREVVRDRRAYELLKPEDPVLEHAWLFRDAWVRESVGEADERFNFRKHEERIRAMRVEALRGIHADRGIEGVAAVAELGKAGFVLGCLLPRVLHTVDERADAIRFLLADSDRESTQSERRRSAVRGLLSTVSEESDDALETLLAAVAPERDFAATLAVLLLAPFRTVTWRLAERLGRDVAASYWRDVDPIWGPQTETERVEAVDRLVSVGRPRAAFALIQLDLEHLRPRQLFGLLRAVATSSTQPAEAFHLDPLRIAEAFRLLTESGEIPVDEMAGLEYTYVEVLDRHEVPIPNLERHVNEHPELFVQAMVATYRRSDGGEDPEEWRAPNEELAQVAARKTHALLKRLSQIPGRNPEGEIDPTRLRAWIREVRGGCAELARPDVCDYRIGALFSKAPVGRDGVWPCEPVREVLDEIANDSVRRGLTIGRFNSRGVVMRGEGGHQERELAAEYASWATALESTHPRVAAILREMVAWYEHDANREDDDAQIRRRLLR